MEASVILSKCSKHKRTFGIRIEKRGSDWVRTWAFPIDEARAKREGFDRTKVTGSLQAVDRYPGCPYCESYSFVKCGCGKLVCYNGNCKYEGSAFRCHWCGNLIKVENIATAASFTVTSDAF